MMKPPCYWSCVLPGYRLRGGDLFRVGIATHFCPGNKVEELKAALLALPHNTQPEHVKALLDAFHQDQHDFSLAPHLKDIKECFTAPTLPQILEKLEKVCKKFRSTMRKRAVIWKYPDFSWDIILLRSITYNNRIIQSIILVWTFPSFLEWEWLLPEAAGINPYNVANIGGHHSRADQARCYPVVARMPQDGFQNGCGSIGWHRVSRGSVSLYHTFTLKLMPWNASLTCILLHAFTVNYSKTDSILKYM